MYNTRTIKKGDILVQFKKDAKEIEKLIFSVGFTPKRCKKHAIYEHPEAGILVVAKTTGDKKLFKKKTISDIKKCFKNNGLEVPAL